MILFDIAKSYLLICVLCIPYLYILSVFHSNVMEPLMNSFVIPFNTKNYMDIVNILMGDDAWTMYNGMRVLPRALSVIIASLLYIPGSIGIVIAYLHSAGMLMTIAALLIVIGIAIYPN